MYHEKRGQKKRREKYVHTYNLCEHRLDAVRQMQAAMRVLRLLCNVIQTVMIQEGEGGEKKKERNPLSYVI